jgi:hypothetical protein
MVRLPGIGVPEAHSSSDTALRRVKPSRVTSAVQHWPADHNLLARTLCAHPSEMAITTEIIVVVEVGGWEGQTSIEWKRESY